MASSKREMSAAHTIEEEAINRHKKWELMTIADRLIVRFFRFSVFDGEYRQQTLKADENIQLFIHTESGFCYVSFRL